MVTLFTPNPELLWIELKLTVPKLLLILIPSLVLKVTVELVTVTVEALVEVDAVTSIPMEELFLILEDEMVRRLLSPAKINETGPLAAL